MTEKSNIGIDIEKKTLTIGNTVITINHPGFWKWFGIGASVVGVGIAIWTQIGG